MAAAAIIGGIGLASAVGGQIASGVSQRNQAERDYEAANEAAKQEVVTTEYEIGQIREQAKKAIGAGIAGYGRSGVVLEGSPLRQIVETTQKSEEDVFWKQQNMKHRVKMLGLGGTSALAGGQAAATQAGLSSTGTFLSGLARMPGVF